MGVEMKIEWTDATWNPWRGCTKVSPGCQRCYAESLSKRNPAVLGEWGDKGRRAIAADSYWDQPIRWDRAAAKEGVRRRVFFSLGDPFERRDDLVEPRERLFATIQATPNLDWLLLTKRPENIGDLASEALGWDVPRLGMPPNVWLGTSVEDQQRANERIWDLIEIDAAVRFLSVEPLLSPIDFRAWFRDLERDGIDCDPNIDWVIVGGESGPGARPCNAYWIRSIIGQCQRAGVACFVKQWGSRPFFDATGGSRYDDHTYHKLADPKGGNPEEWPEDLRVRCFPRIDLHAKL